MSRAYQLQRGKLSDPSEKFSEVKKTFVQLVSLGGPGLALQAADSVEFGLGTNPHALLEMKLSWPGASFSSRYHNPGSLYDLEGKSRTERAAAY